MFVVELALLDRVTVNNTSFISKIKQNLPQVEVWFKTPARDVEREEITWDSSAHALDYFLKRRGVTSKNIKNQF